MTFKRVAQIAVIVALAAIPLVTLAVFVPTPTVPVSGNEVTVNDIERIILRIITFLVTFGIIIAVGVIIYGGIMWMVSAGNEDRADKAKTTIWNGIKGAAIVLGVGVILRTLASLINQDFFLR